MTLHPVIIAIPRLAPPRTARQVQSQRECARAALRRSAEWSGAPPEGWQKSADDVPLPNDGFCWSVSHKRAYAVAVVASGPVGIDVECIQPRERELHDRLAADKEWSLMGDRSWTSFFRLWTAKEAVLKAVGVGIADLLSCRLASIDPPAGMTFRYGGSEWLTEHHLHEGHIFAVTKGGNDVHWHVPCYPTDG